MGIVVFGAVFVDIKGYPLSQYIPGGRNVGRIVQTHGGVSRNVVENIANIELRPTFVSVVDDTPLGEEVIRKLNNHKVETKYIARTPDGLGTWLAVFGNDGDVIASISKRPDLAKIGDILDEKGDEIISRCDSVVVEIDMEPDLLKKIFNLADKYGKEVYAVVSNMSIAIERRDLIKKVGCFVCNSQERGMLFLEDYTYETAFGMEQILKEKIKQAGIRKMVVTMGDLGAVWADDKGESGWTEAMKVDVVDTTGAGDAFFSGVTIGLTYGKSLEEACEIGTKLAGSVIATKESVCPRFLPKEFGIVTEEFGG